MNRGKFYTINVYPSTEDGLYTVVVLRNFGYRVPCSTHRDEPACKICDRMHSAEVMDVRFNEPLDRRIESGEDLVRALHLQWISGHHSKNQALRDMHC